MIALQVVRTSFGFHLRKCMGSCFHTPPPPPLITRLSGGGKTTHKQQKVTNLVHIGVVKDNGTHIATQAPCCPGEDIFTAASFRNESVFGMAVVIVVPA